MDVVGVSAPDFSLIIENNKVKKATLLFLGVLDVVTALQFCPNGAIEIYGRELSPEHLSDLPKRENISSYEQLLSLFDILAEV